MKISLKNNSVRKSQTYTKQFTPPSTERFLKNESNIKESQVFIIFAGVIFKVLQSG